MRKLGFLFIGIIYLLGSCGTSKDAFPTINDGGLSYTITPKIFKTDSPHLYVSFSAKTDENGHIQLGYPNESWGEIDLFRSLQNFKSSPEVKSEIQKDRNQIYVWGEPNKTYSFSYQIIQDFESKPKSENTYRPIVNENYFHILGKNLLLLPLKYFETETITKELLINWKTPKRGFSIVNSFGEGQSQVIKASYHEIYSSIFIGGKLNTITSEINSNKVVLSSTDKWENIDIDQAAKDLSTIIKNQRNFWNDHSTKLQTVTLIKTFEDCPDKKSCNNSISGTALTNSFATFCSDNWLSSNDRVNWLFAHELFHNWVGNTIQNESEEKEYWFSEGFTDYYAYKLLVRSGMMTVDRFIEKVNEEVIHPHYTAPNNNSPNSAITTEKFWSDRMWEKLPYRRGWLYAFSLDTKIKIENPGHSLDDVMHKIMEITTTEKLAFNVEVFYRALEPFVLTDFHDDFYQYIELGNPIDLRNVKPIGLKFASEGTPFMEIMDDSDIDPIEVYNFLSK